MLRQLDLLDVASEPEIAGPMRRVLDIAARVAPLDLTVLITGESGVGKERLARGIHDASRRARGTFVAINCAALTDSLLDSELFGHVKGAFTGALTDARGLFEAAHAGTLFLDEIGDVSPTTQVKLLRVLQEREVRRVGDTKSRNVDVRVIAATNRNLADEMANNRFRPDLYYRLCVIELRVPPLRERPAELKHLLDTLLLRTAARLERPIVGYTEPALERLLEYNWPGNVRELQHVIEHACAIALGPKIDLADLPEGVRPPAQQMDAPDIPTLADRELAYIVTTLNRNNGNKLQTAKELGISRSTLIRRLQKLPGSGVSRHRKRSCVELISRTNQP